jgi:hypothetical protein
MIVSFHRLTCYWLSPNPEDTAGVEAENFLKMVRNELSPGTIREGHIQENYNPEDLDQPPGYCWVRARLQELAKSPAVAGEPFFDSLPVFGAKPWVSESDSFPAFFWRIRSQEGALLGLLEVLAGRDFVTLHQCAISCFSSSEGDLLDQLREPSWMRLYQCQEALFIAEFTQISHLGSHEESRWAEHLAPFSNISPSFCFRPGEIEYRMQLGLIQRNTSAGPPVFEGIILVDRSELETALESGDCERSHLGATVFIPKLGLLIVNSMKVEWQLSEAEGKFPLLDQGLSKVRKELVELQKARAETVPAPLTRGEVERLGRSHHGAWEISDTAEQLLDTSLRNEAQFENLSVLLLGEDDPWARRTRLRLRHANGLIQTWVRSLDRQSRRLRAEIELALVTGRLLAGESSPELLLFSSNRGGRWRAMPSGFTPLVFQGLACDSPPSEASKTAWFTGVESGGGPSVLVLRPKFLDPSHLDDLVTFYSAALRDSSSEELHSLLGSLCGSKGHLSLASVVPGETRSIPVGGVFASKRNVPAGGLLWSESFEFLPRDGKHQFSEFYERLSSSDPGKADLSDWLGLVSLIAFLEALSVFFTTPPDHLSGVAQDWEEEQSRFLFLLALLCIAARREDEAKSYLRRSVRTALTHRDVAWAYFAAQFFQEYESQLQARKPQSDAAPTPRMRRRQPWRDRLALDFLEVYDLGAAVGLVRRMRDGKSSARLRRPWVLRFILCGAAFLTGALLLLTDMWLKSPFPRWIAGQETLREGVLIITATFAFLGAPLALVAGAGGALRRLFPEILYPRILGAITLTTITFFATQPMAPALAAANPLIFSSLMAISLGSGAFYLFWEIQRGIGRGRESFWRCIDLFSLVFLEAVSVSTVFSLLFGKLLEPTTPSADSSAFFLGDVFIRPKTIFLVASLSLFFGIVVQLMIQGGGDKEARQGLS